ncbi:MAG: hypothetical protein KF768_04850 [Phycisphaeraceae bacterium]|nr:hypothetical protein [Phycisphaeraceae bacterium]
MTTSRFAGRIAGAWLLAAALTLTGCDDSSPPPSATGGQGLSGLSEQPTSLAGRSAATGRDAARRITAGQDAASNLADELRGDASGLTVNNLRFPIPSGWEKAEPASRMQLAAFRVSADEGKGETQVVFFTNIGGSAASNIERWRLQVTKPDGQPADAKVERITVRGLDVHTVAMNGTYAGMATAVTTRMPDYGFRAAIVESKSGPIFIRLTGPRPRVEESERAFFDMVKNFSE